MKKICLLLSLATISSSSFAEALNNGKVRVYNQSSLPINVEAYYVPSNWDYANSWQPSKGYAVNMMDRHAEVVPVNSWIDTYSGDNQGGDSSSEIAWNVYGGNINNALSFSFSVTSSVVGTRSLNASFYHGYSNNYSAAFNFWSNNSGSGGQPSSNYDFGSCSAIVVTDTSAELYTSLDYNSCDYNDVSFYDEYALYARLLPPSFPHGAYFSSCSNVSFSNGLLTAVCKDVNGWPRTATLNYNSCPANDTVSSINGYLMCDGQTAKVPLPPGSYTETCDNLTFIDGVLSGYCTGSNGAVGSSLNYNSCPANTNVYNIWGRLTCSF